ncbi:Trimethyllysine dioxygenase [Macrolepiota fuliginosa MF-IS2]|uniref:trimethyllysine dioxygenase n=1 Tax=Macrolepiota fuliginosa MF-IS2 TaxID=1400762 RepID=A0A9P6C8Z7_9AGAR|nr:Trimethyllysine dioxygenase [Macrolepiota fuliginosa MF-IS2]
MLRCRSLAAFSLARNPIRTNTASRRTQLDSTAARLVSRGPSISHFTGSFGPAAVSTQRTSFDDSALSTPDVNDLPIVGIDEREVSVGWNTKTWSRFHNIWLRDHCRCPQCFHPITKQRLLNTFDIPPDIRPLGIASTHEGLEVTWQSLEPHVSFYPWSWLQHNSYDHPISRIHASPERTEWGAKIERSPPTVTYDEAMAEDDWGLFKWLSNIDQFGFSFISGVPSTPEATEKLAERIGFIRETQYGRFWDFTSDLAKGDTAYTTLALSAHTDNTYYTDPSGLQLFHLLSHTDGSGGATLLVDGFYVAGILKELHPEFYEILSKVPVPAHAAGEASSIYRPSPPSGYPVLGHDPCTKELMQVRWNNDDRSVMRHLEPSLVEKWYDAIRVWNRFLTSPDSEYWVQLEPGTVVAIDNHRVLHGRSAFDGKRRMCGAYIGVDEYRSKLAVMRERFAPDSVIQTANRLPGANINGRNVWNPAL